MKKFFIGVLSSVILFGFTMVINQNPKNHLIYSKEIIEQKRVESQVVQTEKVIFEFNDSITYNSSYEEIESALKSENGTQIRISLEVEDNFPFEDEKAPFDATMEEVDTLKKSRREKIVSHYSEANSNYLSRIEVPEEAEIFVSRYSPYIDIYLSMDEFMENEMLFYDQLTSIDFIEKVYISKDDIYEKNINSAFTGVSLPHPSNIHTLSYDGSGVNVGVLEAGGIIDENLANFVGSSFIIRREWYYTEHVTTHANRVASIIGGNTGVARGATLQSVELSGDPKSEVEWLLDHNVDVINNSWGERDDLLTGNYKSNSAYFDHISRTSWVTVVASAGNNGSSDGWVGNPGLGYNVISVGASSDGTVLRDFSSYKENYSVSKPTLVAPGSDISVPNVPNTEIIDGNLVWINSGTSFSAPIVTGIIALLMEEWPYLKTNPEVIIAALTASSTKMSSTYNDYDTSGLEDKVGAGKIHYENARTAISNSMTFSNSNSTTGYKQTKQIYLTAGQKVKISLAWIVDNNNKTNHNVTDYDLHLKNSSGTLVITSSSGGNNIELIEYSVPTSGHYTIGIYQCGEKKGSLVDFGCISWFIS